MEFNKDYIYLNINPFLSINSILLLRQSSKIFSNYVILKKHKFVRNIYLNYKTKLSSKNILTTFNKNDIYLTHLYIDSNYFNTFDFFNILKKKLIPYLHELTITYMAKNPQFIINTYVKYFIQNILINTNKYINLVNINLTFPILWNVYTFNLYNKNIIINTLKIKISFKKEIHYLSRLLNTHNIFITNIVITDITLNIDDFKSYWIDYFKYEIINKNINSQNINFQNINLYTEKKKFNILYNSPK